MALAVVAAVAGLVVTATVIVVVAMRNSRRSSDDVVQLPGPVTALSIRVAAGNVVITGGGRDDAVIRRSVRHGWRAPSIVERVDDGRLVIEARPPTGFLAGWWWIEYEVEVPAHTVVDARTAAGRVGVSNVDGDIVVRTEAGKVHVQGTRGTVHVRAAAGSVEGDALQSPSADVRTQAGHVRLTFDSAPDAVRAVTAAGAVEIRLPGGPYQVDVSSAAGSTRVEVPVDRDAVRTVEGHSAAGTVRVLPRARSGAGADVSFTQDRLDTPDAAELVSALLSELYERYGEEDADAPETSDLAPPDGIFLVARLDGHAVGCGGLRRIHATEAELKRMYVVPDARRLGIGARVLSALESEARRLGYERLRLETGVRQPEAIALYERAGYCRIDNFAPYVDAPLSVCYAKDLGDA